MAYLQNFVFLDASSSSASNTLVVNSKASVLKLSVSGDSVNVTVKGRIDRQSDDFYDIAVTNLSDNTVVSSIKAAGLYSVDVMGIKEVEVTNGGEVGAVNVFGVVAY
jgi:hypothetical protein